MTIKIKAPHDGTAIAIHGEDFTDMCWAIHCFNTQWWLDPTTGQPKERNVGEMLMLATSELAEALEAHRKNKMDEHLPQFHGIDVELVDCIIRCLDLLGARYIQQLNSAGPGHYTPGEVFEAKCKYNSERADHKPENRILPGGKAY